MFTWTYGVSQTGLYPWRGSSVARIVAPNLCRWNSHNWRPRHLSLSTSYSPPAYRINSATANYRMARESNLSTPAPHPYENDCSMLPRENIIGSDCGDALPRSGLSFVTFCVTALMQRVNARRVVAVVTEYSAISDLFSIVALLLHTRTSSRLYLRSLFLLLW
jgi:hypothetical protein